MPSPREIRIADYTYDLPADRIAAFPSAERDASRLLMLKGSQISHRKFIELPTLIPEGALLVMNESKVILARIAAKKRTGGAAEILLLNPVHPLDPAQALGSRGGSRWKVILGGKKIRAGDQLFAQGQGVELTTAVLTKNGMEAEVDLQWKPQQLCLSEVLEKIGTLPLPPYLGRDAVASDLERYQTVYAQRLGSVAAPTAGLHFTAQTLSRIKAQNVDIERVTLHVGAGTFKPVESETMNGHSMHEERITVSLSTLERLILQARALRPIIAVGTTSLRTLESLYWWGCKLIAGSAEIADNDENLKVTQWEPYLLADLFGSEKNDGNLPTAVESLQATREWALKRGLTEVVGQTQLLVAPGIRFGICTGLVTNFHQPGSTLILLVAAFAGDCWRDVYKQALEGGYRFLSYGDSSLIWRDGVN